MFSVTVGAVTTRVSCPLIEKMAKTVEDIDAKVDQLLAQETDGGPGAIVFTIGPVREQGGSDGAHPHRNPTV